MLLHPDPARAAPQQVWTVAEAGRQLARHPLRPDLPLLRHLLTSVAQQHDLTIALADARGRVLAVHGPPGAMRVAARAGLVPGADWSEATIGTNGIGTALAVGRPIQIVGAEHYAPGARALTCWSAPIRCPANGQLVGVINLSAWGQRSTGYELALLVAAAYTVEMRLGQRNPAHAEVPRGGHLSVLGRREGVLGTDLGRSALSARHSEIALLLSWHNGGLTADQLALMLYERGEKPGPARAEVRRFREVLHTIAGPGVTSRPYAFTVPVQIDAADVLRAVERGDPGAAVAAYKGPVLNGSTAPGVVEVRREVAARLRWLVMTRGDTDALLALARMPQHSDDAGLWSRCLELAPERSPLRGEAAARLQRIEEDLAP